MKEVDKKDIISEDEMEALENLVDVIKESDKDKKIIKDDFEEDVKVLKERLKNQIKNK